MIAVNIIKHVKVIFKRFRVKKRIYLCFSQIAMFMIKYRLQVGCKDMTVYTCKSKDRNPCEISCVVRLTTSSNDISRLLVSHW